MSRMDTPEMLILLHCLLENLLKLFLSALTIKFLSCKDDIKHSHVGFQH